MRVKYIGSPNYKSLIFWESFVAFSIKIWKRVSHLFWSNILTSESTPRMQLPHGFSVKGYISEMEERNWIRVPNNPPRLASHLSQSPLNTWYRNRSGGGGRICGQPGVWGRYEDTDDSGLIQAGLHSVPESLGIHLEIIMDYIKVSQEQLFFSKKAFPPEGLLPRILEL